MKNDIVISKTDVLRLLSEWDACRHASGLVRRMEDDSTAQEIWDAAPVAYRVWIVNRLHDGKPACAYFQCDLPGCEPGRSRVLSAWPFSRVLRALVGDE